MPRKSGPLPSFEEASRYWRYDPETGEIRWKIDRTGGIRAGDLAGATSGSGYICIGLLGKTCSYHRIAWLLHTGNDPGAEVHIDHRDGNPHNNRFENLRLATANDNLHNSRKRVDNKSGVKGVHWVTRDSCWRAQVGLNGKIHHVGNFKTIEEAAAAIEAKRAELHGDFTNHG